jgi:hypothetical protein
VHPYHLLRYDSAIFSQPAIEKLQISLKSTVSKRRHKKEAGEGEKPKKSAASPRRRTRQDKDKAAEVA